jgi:hypothetical protein
MGAPQNNHPRPGQSGTPVLGIGPRADVRKFPRSGAHEEFHIRAA